jgi:predicted transcriptional regulator YdeE
MTETTIDSFLVIGVEARTTNAREMSGQGTIGILWGRLAKEGLLDRIPNRVDDRIAAVYSDYESGKDGEYTYLLGAKVHAAHYVPDGMVSRQIRAGKYAMFTANGRPAAEMVISIWKEIWSLETGKKLECDYQTDFEVYSPDTSVEVYIGVLARG